MPETWAGITFDENGVCSLCREHENQENINWEIRQERLSNIISRYKEYAKENNVKYEAIVGISGGKDSIYTLWATVRKYCLKVLVVTFDHGFHLTSEGEWNLSQIPKILDCDHIRFSIGNGLRNALCKKGCELIGDFCLHCHLGVGTTAARISKLWNVPLQIWGEPTALYSTTGDYRLDDLEEQNQEHFEKVFAVGTTTKTIIPDGYDAIDLQPLMWPEGKFPLKAIYLGHFESWDQEEHARIIKQELGWRDYPKQETWQSWDKNDCPLELVREAQKKLRRGFGKASFAASKEIRSGKISREEGMKLVEEYENKNLIGLDEMCQEMGIESFDKLKTITNMRI
jgi:N-acetyl sugar amidotransferase